MKQTKSFEQAMSRLEKIVASLEAGELPLEKSLALFSEGAELVTLCNNKLEEARLKVETLFPGPDGQPEQLDKG